MYVPLTSDLDDSEIGRTVQLAIDLADRGAELIVTRLVPMGPGLELGSGLGDALESMTNSMDGLHVISGAAEVKGVRPMVRSLFTDDPFAEVVRQASTVDADVILFTGARPWWPDSADAFPAQLLEAGTADVALVAWPASVGGPDGELFVTYGDGADYGAAIELATRIARSRGVALEVGRPSEVGRRSARVLAALLEQLGRLGIEIRDGQPSGSVPAAARAPRLSVHGASTEAAVGPSDALGALVTVWARPAIDAESAVDRVGRIVASSATGAVDSTE